MKEKKQSPFKHDYPAAPGVTGGGEGAGKTPWAHDYPGGGMGTTKTGPGHAGGGTPWEHPYPGARQPGHPRNMRGSAPKPLTHILKKRSRGVAKSMGKRM